MDEKLHVSGYELVQALGQLVELTRAAYAAEDLDLMRAHGASIKEVAAKIAELEVGAFLPPIEIKLTVPLDAFDSMVA